MKEYLHGECAVLPFDYRNKEYMVSICRNGTGNCLCRTDALSAIHREDKLMGIEALLCDGRARNRMLGLEEEFTVPIKISKHIAKLFWEAWDEVGLEDPDSCMMTEEKAMRDAKIDAGVLPVIEKAFYA